MVGRRRIQYINPLNMLLCGKVYQNNDFEPEITFPFFGFSQSPKIRPSCYLLLNISVAIFDDSIEIV